MEKGRKQAKHDLVNTLANLFGGRVNLIPRGTSADIRTIQV